MKERINWQFFITNFIAITLFFMNVCIMAQNQEVQHKKHWSYHGDSGPGNWAELNPKFIFAKIGKNQSPINIITSDALKVDLPKINFHYKNSEIEIINNGHTIEVEPEKGNYIKFDGHKYNLLQFHFHSLSEHTINGKHFPLEVHFVHKDSRGNLSVIGLMIKQGAENKNFAEIWNNLPFRKANKQKLEATINPIFLLPKSKDYYKYNGSLTTPPCSEGVVWLVLATPIEMSGKQINQFRKIYDDNYRPVQQQNARNVLSSTN